MVIPDPARSIFIPCNANCLVRPEQRSLRVSIVSEQLLSIACPGQLGYPQSEIQFLETWQRRRDPGR
jgi:hypothetical protein